MFLSLSLYLYIYIYIYIGGRLPVLVRGFGIAGFPEVAPAEDEAHPERIVPPGRGVQLSDDVDVVHLLLGRGGRRPHLLLRLVEHLLHLDHLLRLPVASDTAFVSVLWRVQRHQLRVCRRVVTASGGGERRLTTVGCADHGALGRAGHGGEARGARRSHHGGTPLGGGAPGGRPAGPRRAAWGAAPGSRLTDRAAGEKISRRFTSASK